MGFFSKLSPLGFSRFYGNSRVAPLTKLLRNETLTAGKVESSTFRNIASEIASCNCSTATCNVLCLLLLSFLFGIKFEQNFNRATLVAKFTLVLLVKLLVKPEIYAQP